MDARGRLRPRFKQPSSPHPPRPQAYFTFSLPLTNPLTAMVDMLDTAPTLVATSHSHVAGCSKQISGFKPVVALSPASSKAAAPSSGGVSRRAVLVMDGPHLHKALDAYFPGLTQDELPVVVQGLMASLESEFRVTFSKRCVLVDGHIRI